jgi:hypothetical protein
MMDLEVGEGILSTVFHYKDQKRTLDRIVSPFLGNESELAVEHGNAEIVRLFESVLARHQNRITVS